MNTQDNSPVIEAINSGILGETGSVIELESRAENVLAAACLARQSRKYLHIYSRNLDPTVLDKAGFIASVKKIALSGRFSNILILAADSKRITQRGHRLITLARTLSSRIEIRRPEKQFQSLPQTFITADGRGYIHRKNSERYEGVINFNDARETRELDRLFVDIWQKSQVSPEMRRLNI